MCRSRRWRSCLSSTSVALLLVGDALTLLLLGEEGTALALLGERTVAITLAGAGVRH